MTIHDLLFIRYPRFYNKIDILVYWLKVFYALKIANKIIAISEQTKKDIIKFYKVDPQKIEVIYQDCSALFHKKTDKLNALKIKKKYKLPDQYILCVGTLEERKNQLTLLKAFCLLQNTQCKLVLIGKKTKYFWKLDKFIRQKHIENKVLFIHNVLFSDLPEIYSLASIFVYPSLFEGFGIPLVEAMNRGVPIITTKDSSFYEVTSDAALYANAFDHQSLAQKISLLLHDKELRESILARAYKQIRTFSSENEVNKLINIYSI